MSKCQRCGGSKVVIRVPRDPAALSYPQSAPCPECQDKPCECGHGKLTHHNGRGHCKARVQGYHMQDCNCNGFKLKNPLSDRLAALQQALQETVLLLEDWPKSATDSDFDITEREATIRQARKVLGRKR